MYGNIRKKKEKMKKRKEYSECDMWQAYNCTWKRKIGLGQANDQRKHSF